jgi:hypothetical protein
MVRGDRGELPERGSEVLVDVTTILGAEEYIRAENRSLRPEDPFARQAFVELVQSLIFMSRVHVPHPTLATPTIADFGAQPRFLGALAEEGLVHPLHLDADATAVSADAEMLALADLQSRQGNQSLSRFIEQALICDDARLGTRNPLSARIHDWAAYHAVNVRQAHHTDRISTRDGIEDDPFGEWARAAAIVLRGALRGISPDGQESYVAATLARALKYRARAVAADLAYQAHPMRRDFLLTFDLTREGANAGVVLEFVKAIRGIKDSLSIAADGSKAHRLELLEFELPLLGGRLWRVDERGGMPDGSWIPLVAHRIAEYREHAADLRNAIQRCVRDEEHLRLTRDIEDVKRQLLERLGFRSVDLSPIERDLVTEVASVAESVPGVPKMTGLWMAGRKIGKQVGVAGSPVQRFLYREFVQAWKRTGR